MKKAELLARIDALEARILRLEARLLYPWITTTPGLPNMSPTWVDPGIRVTCDYVVSGGHAQQ